MSADRRSTRASYHPLGLALAAVRAGISVATTIACVTGFACGRGREPSQPVVTQSTTAVAPHDDKHPLIPASTTACTPGGWCRAAELAAEPRGIALCRELWSNPEALWLVGAGSDGSHAALARWDGRRWQHEELAGHELISAAGHNAPWLMNIDGNVWRRVHDRWTSEDTGLGVGGDLVVLGDDDAWAAGPSAVAHRVNGSWQHVATGYPDVDALAAGPDGSIFVAVNKVAGGTASAALLRWDGTMLARVTTFEGPTKHLVVYGRQRVDVIEDDGSVERWTGGATLESIATGSNFGTPSGIEDAAMLDGKVYYVTRSADAVKLTDATWQRVDVPVGVNRVVAHDGVVWAMQRPGGDLWFKRIATAPRDPPVVHEPGPPSSAIEVRHSNGVVAKLLYTMPPGWKRIAGDRIVYAHPNGATLEISVGDDVPDGNVEKAFGTAFDQLTEKLPETMVAEKWNHTDRAAVFDLTLRDGVDRHDVTCLVAHPQVGFLVRIHAGPISDAKIAAALVEACYAASLW